MRLWPVVALLSLTSVARADVAPATVTATGAARSDGDAAPPPQRVGYGALPGGLHIATAESLPARTVELGLISGFGRRGGLLARDHTLDRAIGELAVGYSPVANLAIALSFDGRYDKHGGPGMSDDGYVGDPHLLLRYAAPVGKLGVGAQFGVWVPGKDAPSIAASAISLDGRALVSYDAGFATFTANAGFRVDNSANSVDKPQDLSVEDRVSLGVSDFSAALVGASLRVPLGERLYVALEGSADLFVGTDAPDPILRGGGVLGVAVNDAFSIIGYVEGAKVPSLSYTAVARGEVVLVPYEPTLTGGIGLQARFGGPPRRAPSDSTLTDRLVPEPVPVIETADVTGSVVDDAGKPIVGATITIKLKNKIGTAVSDDKGSYTVARIPIGKTIDGKTELDDTIAELSIEVANKKPSSATLTLTRGSNTVPRVTLDPLLPPGQLRGVIINLGTSRPVGGATLTIEPGGVSTTSGPDGKFTVDLPPGRYKLTVTAKGLAQQQLDVNIDPNGVAIKNIDMHK